jgi:hypothetical protein
MKRSIRPLVLMLAAALGAASIAFSDPVTRERPGTHAVYKQSIEYRTNAFDRNYYINDRKWVPTGPVSELEAKRLKLMFLLMMSLGPYRTPVR